MATSRLQKLLQRSENQRAWTAELRAVLPDPLRYEVEVTDIRGPTAHLLCRSAAAATRLRFMSEDLLSCLKSLASFAQVQELNFRSLGAKARLSSTKPAWRFFLWYAGGTAQSVS